VCELSCQEKRFYSILSFIFLIYTITIRIALLSVKFLLLINVINLKMVHNWSRNLSKLTM